MIRLNKYDKPSVLDASAILALFHREPGSEVVEARLDHNVGMSAVNLAEVISKQMEVGICADETISMLQLLGIRIYDYTSQTAFLTGKLRSLTKSKGLSLGDRACLALAQQINGTVLTADKVWGELDLEIDIVCIR